MRICKKCCVGIFDSDRYVHRCKYKPYSEAAIAIRLVESISNPFSYLKNIIVIPNVTRPFVENEADLIAVDHEYYIKECEIKTGFSDFIHDFKKTKWKKESNMRKFYYAIDARFLDLAIKVERPEGTGLIAMHKRNGYMYSEVIQQAKVNKKAVPIEKEKLHELALIGCRRMWKTEAIKDSFERKIA